MNLIIYIMKNLQLHNDKHFIFFLNYHNNINVTDLELYKFYVSYIHELDSYFLNSSHIIKLYSNAKFIKNSFKKLIRIWKFKKKNIVYDHDVDLYFNPLSDLKPHLKLNILQNNTIYKFRISDLINLWVDALSHTENLFCKPLFLKNPYTNIKFQTFNLYNIFFAIYYSSYNVPEIIYRYFKCGMNIDLYMLSYYPIIKEHAIDNYFDNSTISEQYEFICNMISSMNNAIPDRFFYVPDNPSYNRKKYFVRELKPYLKFYLRGTYSCNPLRKKMAYDRCVELIKIYDTSNPDIISRFSTRTSTNIRSPMQSPLIELPPIPNPTNTTITLPNYDYSEIVTSPSPDNNSPIHTPPWPETQTLLSLPLPDNIEINIPNIPISNSENDNYPINQNDIVLSDIDSNDGLSDYIVDVDNSNNPFLPDSELPRTPPNRQYYNSFQLFPRNNNRYSHK